MMVVMQIFDCKLDSHIIEEVELQRLNQIKLDSLAAKGQKCACQLYHEYKKNKLNWIGTSLDPKNG